jgi:hypothetical protein
MAAEHPALKDFSPTWEGFKHIAGKILKWGAISAAIAAVFVAGPALGIGALSKVGTWIAGIFGGTEVGASATAVLTWGLMKGAALGAVLGGLVGFSGVAKAIEDRKMDKIEMYENVEAYNEKRELLDRQRVVYNGQGGNLSPNVNFGRGNERGAVRGG